MKIDFDVGAGAALIVAVILLAAIARLSSAREKHARVTQEGGSIFLSARMMHLAYGWIVLGAKAAAELGLSATALSWFSLIFGALAGLAAGQGWLGGAAWLLGLSGLGDGLDGAVARLRGTASNRGAVLDSALDRYVEFFFFAGLLYFFRGAPLAQLLVMIALFGGFMVTYSTAKAEALRVKPPRGWMKRAERLVWLGGGAAIAGAAKPLTVHAPMIMLGVVGVIAIFANASAILRLRALARAV